MWRTQGGRRAETSEKEQRTAEEEGVQGVQEGADGRLAEGVPRGGSSTLLPLASIAPRKLRVWGGTSQRPSGSRMHGRQRAEPPRAFSKQLLPVLLTSSPAYKSAARSRYSMASFTSPFDSLISPISYAVRSAQITRVH